MFDQKIPNLLILIFLVWLYLHCFNLIWSQNLKKKLNLNNNFFKNFIHYFRNFLNIFKKF